MKPETIQDTSPEHRRQIRDQEGTLSYAKVLQLWCVWEQKRAICFWVLWRLNWRSAVCSRNQIKVLSLERKLKWKKLTVIWEYKMSGKYQTTIFPNLSTMTAGSVNNPNSGIWKYLRRFKSSRESVSWALVFLIQSAKRVTSKSIWADQMSVFKLSVYKNCFTYWGLSEHNQLSQGLCANARELNLYLHLLQLQKKPLAK